ncbi:helix-turn-helix domain-containing protein [Pedobacter sandarakinus]|uniref:helix-turn-helix domain-containing protein n=1 Tax=Pedobacter sandarakinus TaxID=353156 RepID=UPI0022473B6D|nr:helix-turn-helix domain-containing protein [Pedobacter sandarakinus]MCX2573133.1 hypothetical protein [Pedobacter sandarakinus]
MTTQTKHGEILERIVRRDRMGISELSRKLNVSRRTIYNWFGQDRLSHEVIWQIGNLLGQDLSVSFPDVFPKGNSETENLVAAAGKQSNDSTSVYFWMNKYIHLLEKYNDLLSVEEQQAHTEHQHKTLPLRNRRTESFMFQ